MIMQWINIAISITLNIAECYINTYYVYKAPDGTYLYKNDILLIFITMAGTTWIYCKRIL